MLLKGDMSLVGTTTVAVRDFHGFSEDWQRRRFMCTTWASRVYGKCSAASAIGFEQWMELDLKYLDEWSLWLDLKILAMTIPAVVKGFGAV